MANRVSFLDYLRIFAMFLVVLVHASENYYGAGGESDMAGPVSYLLNETDRLWVSVYDGFSRMSVPLFFIVSAYLLAPMGRGISMGQFYRKRFTKILPPFIIFTIIYSTLPMAWGQIDAATSLHDLSHILLNFPTTAGHFWFMFPLLSIYLFIPIVSPWLEKATARQERFFILLFLISTCMPYLNRNFGEVWGQCFWNQYHLLWYFSGYLGYLVLAHYIRFHLNWSRSMRAAIGAPLLIVGAVATILSFYLQAIPGQELETPVIEIGWAFCTINCVVLTTGAFLLFSCIEQKRVPAPVVEASNLCYGIYLCHILWLGLWVSVFKVHYPLPTAVAIPAIAVCTFICCYISTRLVSYIPGSQWLIGYCHWNKRNAPQTAAKATVSTI